VALDLSRFAKAFYEEAQDHLSAMESLAVAIDAGRGDDESMNALFRAAHSIKGGAAAFGHTQLAEFTHDLETILDRVRKREAALNKAMVDVILEAGDVMRAHVAALDTGVAPDAQAMEVIRMRLVDASAGGGETIAIAAAAPAPTSADSDDDWLEDDEDDFGFFGENEKKKEEEEEKQEQQEIQAAPAEATDIKAAQEPAAMAVADATSIRVSVAKVDSLVNLVGELVITESMLSESARAFDFDVQGRFAEALSQLERNTRNLQEAILGIRMIPISFVFSRLPRMARDVAARLGKDIELEIHGEETELDKRLIEQVTDPLLHLVRNAIDHGIEAPATRVAKGKPARGHVRVGARHQGGMVVITVVDDGAGLDRLRILKKAAELGLEADPSWSDAEVWKLVFAPGFSTSSEVTDVSGRGVGMDVVRRNVEALGGAVEIDSVAGAGATLTIRLPLTLAIVDGMSISVDGDVHIVPLANIEQSLRPAPEQVSTVGGHPVLDLGGAYLPIVRLNDETGTPRSAAAANDGLLVVLEADGRRAALAIDDVLGQHQVVLKSLEDNYRKVPGFSGATILGDGRVSFILDASHIVGRAHRKVKPDANRHDPALAA
jgi:two-component system chemotaxis sensor kinase CheA